MKKYLFLSAALVFVSALVSGQGFYHLAFKDIDGNDVSMHTFVNKKLLFFLVPLSQNDPHFQQLLAFKQRYGDTVAVVGIPSVEDGYTASQVAGLKTLYSPLGITLAEGMYTKKSSPQQSRLMKWLTDKNKNRHFDNDSKGIGSKFFVTRHGRLFAVLSPQLSLHAPLINRIVQSTAQ